MAMRYRPGLPLVLRGVTFVAAAKEKVGHAGMMSGIHCSVQFSILMVPQFRHHGRSALSAERALVNQA